MRKIKIGGIVHKVNISDGKDGIPFGCNGVGGMSIFIDERLESRNGFIEGTDKMLDGKVNFIRKSEVKNFSNYDQWIINDPNYEDLKRIHSLDYEAIKKIDFSDRVKTILWGLKYDTIKHIQSGYRFGKELTFNDFCVCFNSYNLVIFKSSHHGFIAPDFINLKEGDSYFKEIIRAIKKTVYQYFDFV